MMKAPTDHPVHDLIANRWSPYGFSPQPVAKADLRSLFEAAGWAPSSYNEQPWRYIVAEKENKKAFERLLSCLIEANRKWAKFAPVLVLGIAKLRFTLNDKPNKSAFHDLGLAGGNLLTEATARGLCVHQMIGIHPEKARQIYGIPDGFEALTAMAIGYPGISDGLSPEILARDGERRPRNPIDTFVFGDDWDVAADLT